MRDYEIYRKKYALKHGISEEEAEEHRVVKDYKEMVGDRETDSTGRIITTEMKVGGC